MSFEQRCGKAQLTADLAHLILIERAERLDDATLVEQFLNAGDPVVVRLDSGSALASAGFDRIGVDGALSEHPMAVEQTMRLDDALLFGEELLANDVALALGI